MNLRNLFCVGLVLIFSHQSFGQTDWSHTVTQEGGILRIHFKEVRFEKKITEEGQFRIVDYPEFTGAGNPGEVKLPVITFTAAVPEKANPSAKFLPINHDFHEKSIPRFQPAFISTSDSTYRVESVAPVLSKMTGQTHQISISKVYRLRDFFSIDVIINPVSYDINSNRITEHTEFIIEIDFGITANITQPKKMNLLTDFDRMLQNTFINAEHCENFRISFPPTASDTLDNWIDYSKTYVRFKVGKDGIYRIRYQDLENLGISPSAIQPQTFRIFTSGKEEPCFVAGENDGIFDTQDYIEFTATLNYNKNYRQANSSTDPYVDYLNKFSDSTVYFLTWGGAQGERLEISNLQNTGLSDSLKFYTFFEHREVNSFHQHLGVNTVDNQNPEFQSLRNFVWNWIFVGTNNQTFTATDLVPGRLASALYKVISVGSPVTTNSHKIAVKINGVTVDTQVVNRNQVVVAGSYFSSNLVTQGTNTFTFQNYEIGLSPNFFAYDWIEYEYPRMLRAFNDSLTFRIRDTLPDGQRVIVVSDVSSSDIMIYKRGQKFKKFAGFQVSGGMLTFIDTVKPGDQYYLLSQNKFLTPKFEVVKQFRNLRATSQEVNYAAITDLQLKDKATEYVNFVRDAYPLTAELYFTSDIFDEFGYGYPNPQGIKEFLRMLLNKPAAPKLSYVNLIGAARYDFNRNFFKIRGYEVNPNLVPSYAEPVSDTWYAMMSEGSLTQSFLIGRIPVKNSEMLDHYLQKHRKYREQRYDSWNRRALFFSSGDGNNEPELLEIRRANQFIIDNYTNIEPFRLSYDHFYKTVNPSTDFGPYPPSYIRNSISEGGVFISYLGHSGTRTWDNSISDPSQLLNNYNKGSLVTDFGCSTNKFAEADVEAFGALFVNEGQTIGYIGNSSLGFSSTTLNVSKYFYESILKDSILNLGSMHYIAKQKMFSRLGSSGVYRVFAYTNLLLGDPVVNLALPLMPNFFIEDKNIYLNNSLPDENTDSLGTDIVYFNYGSVIRDTVKLRYRHIYEDTEVAMGYVNLGPMISDRDTVSIFLSVKNKPGRHKLMVELDSENAINELYEDDNNAAADFTVASLNLKNLVLGESGSLSSPEVRFLNSFLGGSQDSLIVEYATNEAFSPAMYIKSAIDTFYSTVSLNSLSSGQRYWLRGGILSSDTLWSGKSSFLSFSQKLRYLLKDEYGYNRSASTALLFDNGIQLRTDTIYFEVKSGGGNFSGFGSISRNGVNLINNTFGLGMGCVVIDSATLEVEFAKTFDYGYVAAQADSLAKLIEDLGNGKYVALCVIFNGRTNLSTRLRTAIKTLGAARIDGLNARYPYILFGKKGAAPGTVPEFMENDLYTDFLRFDTLFTKRNLAGELLTESIRVYNKPNQVMQSSISPSGSSLKFTGYGIKTDGSKDSLFSFPGSVTDFPLSGINPDVYPQLQIRADFTAAPDGSSPVLEYLGVNWDDLPEVGMNYQTVSLAKDTLRIGEPAPINITVANAGGAVSDTFYVAVVIRFQDNSTDTVSHFPVYGIGDGERKKFVINYSGSIGPQSRVLQVTVDSKNSLKEVYEDNNVFSIPFYIEPDTTQPYITIRQDGRDFFEGELLPAKPEFEIGLYDASLLPVTDPASIKLYLNDEPVAYEAGVLEAVYSTANPKMKLVYTPSLSSGAYSLKIEAKDALGNPVVQGSETRSFVISDELRITDLYAYPNPSSGDLHFTFMLGRIPEEAEIQVFTVAGRLVRTIKMTAVDLKYDFNRIYFDGRDQDGDPLASGTYLYTMKIKSGGKTERTTKKLAIVR
ncbi:MAG: hypothetical protein FMNOHCHN_02014 [Ignavibacteriaceae bacterium]|nr:hypothetical protein [Ignavibacteriaceae bacterium]